MVSWEEKCNIFIHSLIALRRHAVDYVVHIVFWDIHHRILQTEVELFLKELGGRGVC